MLLPNLSVLTGSYHQYRGTEGSMRSIVFLARLALLGTVDLHAVVCLDGMPNKLHLND